MGRPPGHRFAGLLIAALLITAAPWRLVDPDSLSRLAVGRWLAGARDAGAARDSGTLLPPGPDPFTFGARPATWSHPEWLSDLLWHGAERGGGEAAVVLWTLTLVLLGGGLLRRWALERGATPVASLAIIALWLPLAAERLVARGELHALWALPLAGLLVVRLRGRRRLLPALTLGALALLWSCLHGSFVLLVPLVLLEASGALAARRWRDAAALALTAALCAALPFAGPGGLQVYAQVLEHLRGASIYRSAIQEWQPPWQVGGALALAASVALALLAFVGLALRWRVQLRAARDRGERGALIVASGRVALALVLAAGAQRFTVLLVPLALPELALGLTALGTLLTPRWRRPARLALAATATLAVTLTLAAARLYPRTPVLAAPRARLAQRLCLVGARSEPRGLRLLAPFDVGPWLLHAAAAQRPLCLRLWIDPRNTRGADTLAAWLRILREPPRLATLARTDRIDAVLVEPRRPRQRALALWLARSPDWIERLRRGGAYLYLRRGHR